tara:strand:+ start:2641 stop:2820 length:180 start_codon:yes stop_codon:yes gene_type:complete
VQRRGADAIVGRSCCKIMLQKIAVGGIDVSDRTNTTEALASTIDGWIDIPASFPETLAD